MTDDLTPEKVASYLPFSGHQPDITGRIINVTHQIPYNIIRKKHERPIVEESDGAPISKVSRRHHRQHTLRAKFHTNDWTVVQRRGHAALYSGLQNLGKEFDAIHIGWTGPIKADTKKTVTEVSAGDKLALKQLLWDTGKIIPIFLDNASRGHYEGYCKEVLWPLFHYVVWSTATDGRAEKRHWADYKAVNQQFAQTIIDHYRPGDIIWIHDYHLLLVPEMVRKAIPDATIGVFFHATFPSSEIFRCLTTRNEILQGVLGANLIGFQTFAYARHFISSSTRVLGCESTLTGVNFNGQIVSAGTFPIGIDVDRVYTFCKQPQVQPKIQSIREMYLNRRIIIGRDKLDATKGILQKLHAFEKFLHDYPAWRNKVVLIQVTTPTHGDHGKLESKISETVSHINGLYGSLEFTPIHYFHQDIDRDEYYALLSVADVGLITSVRDGMNTTSFEYIICQHETSQGPLILSEFTGTAGSLSAALLVNPWDYAGVARAINDALIMSPEEKHTRHMQLYSHVTNHTASFWAHSFVTQLVSTKEQQSLLPQSARELDLEETLEAYVKAEKRLLLFDYDGTLAPIVSVPSDARPSADMLNFLQKLCDDPKNQVWVISGRDQETLDNWLGHLNNLGLSAEHGCYIKKGGTWENIVEQVDMSWKDEVSKIFNYYTERTQGSFIEHKKSSITWHYRMADVEYGEFQAKECQNHLENNIVPKLPVEILVGKKNLEVRPVDINKGVVAKRILKDASDVDFVVCAGDDKTDEDMFRFLSAAHLSVTITSGASSMSSPPLTPLPSASSSSSFHKGRSPSIVMTSPPLPDVWKHPSPDLFCITVGPDNKKTMANRRVRTSQQIVDLLELLSSV
ncbi:glycosyltransferase family 20-domain-containing protein [Fennellomyces sp. T-0311]|nr:glycosyltransferase family 20-domain-containing protein [Fennellomyces sp. T-0311]